MYRFIEIWGDMSLKAHHDKKDDVPHISIVIISKDRHEELLKTLRSLKSIVEKQEAEIVVVEETEIGMPVEGVTYVDIPRKDRGFGYARNIGLDHARGDVICFLDDDCRPDEGWLSALLSSIEEGADGVGGAILPQPTNTIGRSVALLGFPAGGLARIISTKGLPVESRHISTGNCAIRLSALERIGRFREDFRYGGEDQDLFKRLSAASKTVYNPNAVVFHKQREDFGSIFFWFLRRGQGEINLLRKGESGILALFSPWRNSLTLRAAVFCLLVVAAGWAPAVEILLLIAAGYLILTLLRVWKRHRITDPVLKAKVGRLRQEIFTAEAWLLTPVTKMTMDIAFEIGKWVGFFNVGETRP